MFGHMYIDTLLILIITVHPHKGGIINKRLDPDCESDKQESLSDSGEENGTKEIGKQNIDEDQPDIRRKFPRLNPPDHPRKSPRLHANTLKTYSKDSKVELEIEQN